MKYIVHKAYWNYEKEEIWLNEMSAKGMALTDYSWCRYVFTETPNNEYIYKRINVLWITMMFIEFIAGFSNITIGIINLNTGSSLGDFTMGNLIMGCPLVLLGLLFLRLGSPIRKKIKKLQQERAIRE